MADAVVPTPVDQLRQYTKGELLRAADVNSLIAHAKGQLTNEIEGDGRLPGYRKGISQPQLVYCINRNADVCPTGAIVKQYGNVSVAGLNGYSTDKPDGTYSWSYLVNIDRDTPTHGPFWAAWLHDAEGLALLGDAYATDLEWGPKKNDWSLWPARPGFIFRRRDTTATGLGCVIQRIPPVLIGHALHPIAHGSSNAVMVYGGTNFTTSLEYSIPSCRNLGPDIGADDVVSVSLVCGQPVCSLLDCGS